MRAGAARGKSAAACKAALPRGLSSMAPDCVLAIRVDGRYIRLGSTRRFHHGPLAAIAATLLLAAGPLAARQAPTGAPAIRITAPENDTYVTGRVVLTAAIDPAGTAVAVLAPGVLYRDWAPPQALAGPAHDDDDRLAMLTLYGRIRQLDVRPS